MSWQRFFGRDIRKVVLERFHEKKRSWNFQEVQEVQLALPEHRYHQFQ
jgi:hypothetical protein